MNGPNERLVIREASAEDVGLILSLIRELAEYERLADQVVATEELLQKALFGERRFAEAIIGEYDGEPVAFALFFPTLSTFLARPGIYLEDLYVREPMRGRGIGQAMLVHLARLARERGCGRLEWAVLNWNDPAIRFYKNLGAIPLEEWTVYRLTGDALTQAGRGASPE